jgi:hypothetical protein
MSEQEYKEQQKILSHETNVLVTANYNLAFCRMNIIKGIELESLISILQEIRNNWKYLPNSAKIMLESNERLLASKLKNK